MVIDLFGLDAAEVRQRYPAVYQWVLERVKPERDAKGSTKDGTGYAKLWWIHGKPRQEMRKQLAGLSRYIATVETAKHRTFQFLDASVMPDNMLIAVAADDAFTLGVLSSAVHVHWALATGGTLEDRPRYNKSRCFETFPFPCAESVLTPDLKDLIGKLAEQIDTHRKARQSSHADLTLTSMYNVLEQLRTGAPLNTKDKLVHDQGLVGVLKSLHDELDTAVLAAYGWADLVLPADTETLLQRLVALNAQRCSEEAAGTVRWLRPSFQRSQGVQTALAADHTGADSTEADTDDTAANPAPAAITQRPWPAGVPEQIKAVADVLSQARRSLDLEELASHFSGRGRWRERLPTLLDTLLALGLLQQTGQGRWVNTVR
jgi:hypothetical protein